MSAESSAVRSEGQAAVRAPVPTLLVTNEMVREGGGGRELLCALNHDLLRELCGEALSVLELRRRPLRGLGELAYAFAGHLDGVNRQSLDEVLATIAARGIRRVFIDGSNLGELARAVKARFPSVQVVTFFHNVETRFFFGALKTQRSVRSFGVFVANGLAERKAATWSDQVVCLSARDAQLIRRLFGRSKAEVSALALRDRRTPGPAPAPQPRAEPYALFVGGLFYANLAGIEWFIEHVVPRIGIKVCVVGRGFEAHRARLERRPGVEVIGAVESLEAWYAQAHFVVAPIFDGSGMKTKVAEALMYGKRVVGTPEAFSGYEAVESAAGWVCRSATEFVEAIEQARQQQLPPCDPELRRLYETHYSFGAALERLAKIIDAPAKRGALV